ncbi:MAG TPA: hypothetical protein VIZ62_12230 [Nitrososphaeraceae archaeon]|jgi:hypothetical protein
MIEDISTTKDIVKEEQIKTCDICNNEINTLIYLNVSSSSNSSNTNKTKKSEVITNNNEDLSDKYYNICLNCVEKITELMKYNYGFNGRLIQFFESLTEKK